MAKMFYTLDEVCTRLGKSQEEVEAMVSSGQIQEFRDGESLVFKVDQVDLLTVADESGGDIELDLDAAGIDLGDSAGIDLSASGSAEMILDDASAADLDAPTPLPDKAPQALGDNDDLGMDLDGSSIESFDLGGSDTGGDLDLGGGLVDELDLSAELSAPEGDGEGTGDIDGLDVDEAGETRVGEGIDDLTLESVGSGSGLLDLTNQSDDTSLGAELLEDAFTSEDDFIDVPAASGLFEASEASGGAEAISGSSEGAPALATPAAAAVAAQAWDPSGSGLATGLCIGAMVCLIGLFAIVGVEAIGGASGLAPLIGEKLWIWTGGIAGGTVLLGLIGLLIGKKSG